MASTACPLQAHRLKNDSSQLYIAAQKLKTKLRYLLTGTVMQAILCSLCQYPLAFSLTVSNTEILLDRLDVFKQMPITLWCAVQPLAHKI